MLLLVAALLAVGCSSQGKVGTTGTSAPPTTRVSASTTTTGAAAGLPPSTTAPSVSTTVTTATTVFAVIGDYGTDDENEAAVARLVASWRPAYIITTGDDYYTPAGGKGTGQYDESTGAYYGS